MFADLSPAGVAASHVPVMRERTVELLAPALQSPGAVYVDGTLGMGGHAEAILDACPNARLIGLDRDPAAIEMAGVRLARFGDRIRLVEATYDELGEVCEELSTTSVAAILLDLGLSSLQIDRTDRGFAYATDARLDMRMDQQQDLTAAEVVNTYTAVQLATILRRYGDEKFADRIAKAIVCARAQQPFETSARLVSVIADAIPAAARFSGGHPAKRTFQALRIEVNAELDILADTLPVAIDQLGPDGRIVVMAYHSGEDRLVKAAFRDATTDAAPPDLPIVPPNLRARAQHLTRGAERPSPAEVAANPRAASVRLRAVRILNAEEVDDQ